MWGLMTLVDFLRAAALCGWLFVLALHAGSIWRVMTNRARYYDALWALVSAFGAHVVCFNLRWIVAADSVPTFAGLYVFSILLALATIGVSRRYQATRDE